MQNFFRAYPYLIGGVMGFAALLVGTSRLSRAEHRRIAIRLGLMMLPNFLYSALVEQDYWNPRRLGGWILGVEDLLCSFDVGAAAFLPAVLVFGSRLDVPAGGVPNRGRIGLVVAVSTFLWLSQLWMGHSSMGTLIVTQSVLGLALVARRPDLWPLSVAGSAGFLFLYGTSVKAIFWAWPEFVTCWRSEWPWGELVYGLPLGELAWAASFGFFWPLFAGFVFDLRLAPARRNWEPQTLFPR